MDAHVGKKVFENVLLDKQQAEKTRILVTHALHFLPQVDYIYVIDKGQIAEQGTYSELISAGNEFSLLIADFGTSETVENNPLSEALVAAQDKEDARLKDGISGDVMMQMEERNIGAVSSEVYKVYLSAGHARVLLPILLFSLVLTNVASVLSSYW